MISHDDIDDHDKDTDGDDSVKMINGTWIWWPDVRTLSLCITSSEKRISNCVTGFYETWFPPWQPYVNDDCAHPEK